MDNEISASPDNIRLADKDRFRELWDGPGGKRAAMTYLDNLGVGTHLWYLALEEWTSSPRRSKCALRTVVRETLDAYFPENDARLEDNYFWAHRFLSLNLDLQAYLARSIGRGFGWYGGCLT